MTENGRLFAEKAGEKIEVVIATAKQAVALVRGAGLCCRKWGYGASATFLTLGIIYFVVMIVAAFSYRVPPKEQEVGAERVFRSKHDYKETCAYRSA